MNMFKTMQHSSSFIGLILYCSALVLIAEAKTENHEYCVIGAGPGGKI